MKAISTQRPLGLTVLGIVALSLFAVGAYLALVYAPRDFVQGDLIRIMFAHVPVAWVGFLAVIVTAIFGSLYLWLGRQRHDIVAVAAAESALFFFALTMLGGMIYSRPTLGTFWTWDAKLTLTAIMFTLLVGYFIVRGLIDDPERRGRVSAVIGLIVAASLPFNWMAAEWFRTLHPARAIVIDDGGVRTTMAPIYLQILLFNVAVAALIFLYFVLERIRIGKLEAALQAAEDDRGLAGTTEVVRV
ncbi:MAG: cytochrome c biogenesis protein CcsA [Truepera sp.]|nr:cytochrome c biogenesis protein CcsA [Truepera sp.]